jgi:hypothetical protein
MSQAAEGAYKELASGLESITIIIFDTSKMFNICTFVRAHITVNNAF